MKRKTHLCLIAFALLAASVSLASGAALALSGDTGACPHSPNAWASQLNNWPVTGLMIGSQFYNQTELRSLLPDNSQDASMTLASQFTAAQLNIAAGSDPTAITSVLPQVDAILAQFSGKLPYNVAPATQPGQTMTGLTGLLANYNNAQLTPNCIQVPAAVATLVPIPTTLPTTIVQTLPTMLVVEGPVQAINGNTIRIFDIDVEIDVNDLIWQQIRVGIFVRVQGNLISGTSTITVRAVTTFVVTTDVVVTNNNVIVWQNNGNCSNPPPPWAPAWGWRRRCQGLNAATIFVNQGNNGNGNGKGNGKGMGMGG